MDSLNFIKNIDNLGRIVIPIDVRKKLNINTGDNLSISCIDDKIYMSKFNCLENNCKVKKILDYFIEYFKLKIILISGEKVIYSNVINNVFTISNDLISIIKSGNIMKYIDTSFLFDEKYINGCFNMLPIIGYYGIVGNLIILGDVNSKSFEFCSLIVKLIELDINIS